MKRFLANCQRNAFDKKIIKKIIYPTEIKTQTVCECELKFEFISSVKCMKIRTGNAVLNRHCTVTSIKLTEDNKCI